MQYFHYLFLQLISSFLLLHVLNCLFQVKTGKTSLEQISRVYGNQVPPYCMCLHALLPFIDFIYILWKLICQLWHNLEFLPCIFLADLVIFSFKILDLWSFNVQVKDLMEIIQMIPKTILLRNQIQVLWKTVFRLDYNKTGGI